jgi:plasmid stabilization system protein ParE
MRGLWTESALDLLADIYAGLGLDDQREMARQVEQMNTQLASNPEELGESRPGGRRIWFPGPVVLSFRISGGTVEVLHVTPGRFGRPLA